MKLSVIIPTKNRANLLRKCLDSIVNQSINQNVYEVIVVDNGSTDNTRETVEGYLSKIRNLIYVYEEQPGLHAARHRGLFVSKGEVLVYIDDDIEACYTWLESILESFQDQDVVLVGGKVLPKYEAPPPDWIINIWNKNMAIPYLSIIDLGDEAKYIEPTLIFGCNFSIRKSILLEAGGFHPDGMPRNLIKYRGDGETYVSRFIQRKGYKAMYNPKVCVYHYVSKERMTTDYFKKRAFLQGISDSYTDIREGKRKILIIEKIKNHLRKILRKETLEYDIYKSYIEGYLYHQREAQNNKELLNWVLKENYLE